MNKLIKKVWNDPVWSGVIGSVVFALLGIIWSSVKSLLSEETFAESLKSFFTFSIQLWIIVLVALIIAIVAGLYRRLKTPKRPKFLDFTKGTYQSQQWSWTWEKVGKNSYRVENLYLMCPACHTGVMDLIYDSYKCGKCGADIPWTMIQVVHDSVETQIAADARTYYPDESDMIKS